MSDVGKERELPAVIQESLNKIINDLGFKEYEVKKNCVSTRGGTHMSDLFEVSIKGKTVDGEKETNLFIKNIIGCENKLTVVSLTDVYGREIFFYTELSKILNELQNEAKVPETEKYRMLHCYDAPNAEAIILESMTKEGFKVHDRTKVVTLKYAESAIQALAKFHSFSFVLQKKRPEYYETVIKSKKTPYTFNEDFRGFVRLTFNGSLDVLKSEDTKKKFKWFADKIDEKYEYLFDEKQSEMCVLCHGDFGVDNILINEVEGTISRVIPIDYQLISYENPMNDLLHFIFITTDHQFRKNHLNHLKDLYFNTIDKFLSYFDIKVEDVYPRASFEKDYKKRLDYGLISGVQALPFIFPSKDDAPDLKEHQLSAIHISKNENYIERINGLVEEFIEWGYL